MVQYITLLVAAAVASAAPALAEYATPRLNSRAARELYRRGSFGRQTGPISHHAGGAGPHADPDALVVATRRALYRRRFGRGDKKKGRGDEKKDEQQPPPEEARPRRRRRSKDMEDLHSHTPARKAKDVRDQYKGFQRRPLAPIKEQDVAVEEIFARLLERPFYDDLD